MFPNPNFSLFGEHWYEYEDSQYFDIPTFPQPTLQPIPKSLSRIANILQSTSYETYEMNWFNDNCTDIAHEPLGCRVAVASLTPYSQIKSTAKNQTNSGVGNPVQLQPSFPTFDPLPLAQTQNLPQLPPNLSSIDLNAPLPLYPIPQSSLAPPIPQIDSEAHQCIITTPAPEITIFARGSSGQWAVQNVLPRGHIGRICKLDWSHADIGTFLAACSDDGMIFVYEEISIDDPSTVDSALTHLIQEDPQPIHNHNQKHLLDPSSSSKNTNINAQTSLITLLSQPSSTETQTMWVKKCIFQSSLDPVVFLKWSPRHLGLKLSTCGLNGKVHIYDLISGEDHEITVFDYDCTACAWNHSPYDTPMLLVVADVYAQVYEYVERASKWFRQVVFPVHDDTLTACAWAQGYGRPYHVVATGDRSGVVRVFRLYSRGFDGLPSSKSICELVSVLIPFQERTLHYNNHEWSERYAIGFERYIEQLCIENLIPSNSAQNHPNSTVKPDNMKKNINLGDIVINHQFIGGNMANLAATNPKQNTETTPVETLVSPTPLHTSPDQCTHNAELLMSGTRNKMTYHVQKAQNIYEPLNNISNITQDTQNIAQSNKNQSHQPQKTPQSPNLSTTPSIDTFLGLGPSITAIEFDPTGKLLSVIDDVGTTTLYMQRFDGFWVPANQSPSEQMIIDEYNIPINDPYTHPMQFLRQQQQLRMRQSNFTNGNDYDPQSQQHLQYK